MAVLTVEKRGTYDRRYVCDGVTERLTKLHERYYMYCNGVNESGREMSPGGAAVGRSKCKTDMEVLALIDELLGHIDHDFTLSDDASRGYEKLCEPYERHRNTWEYQQ
jgi:hypothetical protein